MATSKISGAWGEAIAAEYLRKKRYKIVAAGYRCRFGEIDLIAQNKQTLVFVEVKLRKNADFAAAREYVNRAKQDRTGEENLIAMGDLTAFAEAAEKRS